MNNEEREWQHFELMQRQLRDREESMEQLDKETDELEQDDERP